MTRYSFTGPPRLTIAERAHAATVVAGLEEPSEITTGAATGWDMAVALAALAAWPDALHRIVCPGAPYDRMGLLALTDTAIRLKTPRFEVITLPPLGGPGPSYRARNERLVDHCDVMVGAVHNPRFYRSGEWMTLNIAKKAGRRVQLVDLGTLR